MKCLPRPIKKKKKEYLCHLKIYQDGQINNSLVTKLFYIKLV